MKDMSFDRIVIINDRSAAVGGASNLAVLLARRLENEGVSTTFFAGDRNNGTIPCRDTINLNMAPLTEQSKKDAFVSGLYNTNAYARLNRLITERDTPRTIYHVHGWSKILSPSIFRALNRVRDRTILHAHDYFLACPNGGFANFQTSSVCSLSPMSRTCLATQCDKRGLHQKLWRAGRHALREKLFPVRDSASNIIMIHEGMHRYFERAGIAQDKLHVVRNPIDPFIEISARPWLQKDFFFIGRLEPEKGFEDAARAAKRAGVRLHVIGDGAGRELLEREYPDVLIHGWKTKEQMRPLLLNARAVVIASRVPEPFGLVAIEAIASGIPVILPDAALLADEIVSKACGLQYKSGDIGSLSSAMREMARDSDSVQWMSINGFLAAGSMSKTTDGWVRAIKDIYDGVLADSREAAATRLMPSAKSINDYSRSGHFGLPSTPYSVGAPD